MKQIVFFSAVLMLLCGCSNHSRRSEIEARKAALVHKQDSTLTATQHELAATDSMMEAVKREHAELHQWVMSHATALNEKSPEVMRLNALRARLDSLQVQWQTLGAKIKYIRQLQEKHQAQ